MLGIEGADASANLRLVLSPIDADDMERTESCPLKKNVRCDEIQQLKLRLNMQGKGAWSKPCHNSCKFFPKVAAKMLGRLDSCAAGMLTLALGASLTHQQEKPVKFCWATLT